MTAVEPDSGRSTPPQRRRRMRRSLALTLISVTLLSVLLLGALNYYQASELLTTAVETQLRNQQEARTQRISRGVSSIRATVSALARDGEVVDALQAFSDAHQSLGSVALDADADEALEEFYRDQVLPSDLEIADPADLAPADDAGRYLQYHYVVANPYPAGEREGLLEAEGDDSAYRPVHAEWHPRLDETRKVFGYGDLLLIDAGGSIVYTSEKRLDFAAGTVLFDETGGEGTTSQGADLGRTVSDRLAAAPVGQTIIVDFVPYRPDGGSPTLFFAAAMRADGRQIGAVVVQIPLDLINRLTTADGRWEETGLGETGETYIVGPDSLMRSDARLWLEDPTAYLEALAEAEYPAELSSQIQEAGTVVLHQPVETEAVEQARDGEMFAGRTRNYLGERTLTVAGPVDTEELDWIVVAEISAAEANSTLRSYLVRLLLVAAILVPVVAVIAVVLADRMTRPVTPVVGAAANVAAGDLTETLPDLGRNEFGDVARRLNILTADLRQQESALEDEEREITRLLHSALPPRLVDQLRDGDRRIEDLIDSATVIVVTVEGVVDQAGIDPDAAVEAGARLSELLEEAAETLGIERVRSSSDQHVFLAGVGRPDAAGDAAAEFAVRVGEVIDGFGEDTGSELRHHAALCSGEVIAGLLRADQLTYGVFGDAARTAMALDAVAPSGTVLVHESTVLGPSWRLEPAADLVDLRGDPLTAWILHRA